MKFINGHACLTPAECVSLGHPNQWNGECVICEYGFCVCELCGTYEAGLDAPCTAPEPDKRIENLKAVIGEPV